MSRIQDFVRKLCIYCGAVLWMRKDSTEQAPVCSQCLKKEYDEN